MSKMVGIFAAVILSLFTSACGADNSGEAPSGTEKISVKAGEKPASEETADNKKTEENIMYIRIGDTVLTAELADNSSAKAFMEMLSEGDVTVDMHDYGNFEKVGGLGKTLPRNDEQITTQAGDIILYQGNNITIYYDTNSWNFTRLGKIKDVSGKELKKILGDGNVTVTFSLES